MKHLGIVEADFVIYEDEGFSGGNIKRPQFQKMLKDARARKFDVLICYRLDRISRNVSDFSQLIKELNKFNVNFVSIKEQFDTTTPMGRAMMYIASVFSQLERGNHCRENQGQYAAACQDWTLASGGTPPTGYKSEAVITADSGGKEKKNVQAGAGGGRDRHYKAHIRKVHQLQINYSGRKISHRKQYPYQKRAGFPQVFDPVYSFQSCVCRCRQSRVRLPYGKKGMTCAPDRRILTISTG